MCKHEEKNKKRAARRELLRAAGRHGLATTANRSVRRKPKQIKRNDQSKFNNKNERRTEFKEQEARTNKKQKKQEHQTKHKNEWNIPPLLPPLQLQPLMLGSASVRVVAIMKDGQNHPKQKNSPRNHKTPPLPLLLQLLLILLLCVIVVV